VTRSKGVLYQIFRVLIAINWLEIEENLFLYFADIVCCICCSVCFCLHHGGSGYEDCSYCVGYFRLLFCRSVPIIQRDSSKTYRFVNDSVAFAYILFRIMKKRSPIHLTTSKAMVIVWRLRVNIVRTVSLQWAQLKKTVHTAWLGLEFVFLC